MGARPKASPIGLFAKSAGKEEEEEEEEAPATISRSALPRSGLPPPTPAPDLGIPGLASGLAAAQAAAAKFNEQFNVMAAKTAEPDPEAMLEEAEIAGTTESGGVTEMTRGGYTFCRKCAVKAT